MFNRLTDAQTVGFALVILGVMFGVGWIVRSRLSFLRAMFIPSSIVAGFLVLLLGPQVLGRLIGTNGLFPTEVLDIWRVMPGLLINVVFGAIMIGKTLPTPRRLWQAAAPHALFGTFLSLGQFALAGLAVLFILGPVFGLPPAAGALLEMSFAGGHGTIAGMGQLLAEAGAPELVDVGLGLATISMITGIGVGSALVRWAVRSPRVTVARNAALTTHDDYDIDRVRPAPVDERERTDDGIHSTVLAFALIAAAIAVAIALLWGLRWVANAGGSDIFDRLPLFPITVIGGFLVQWLATKTGQAAKIDKRAVDGISAVALDALLVCAIGTMSLAALASNVPAIIVFTVIGVLWSAITLIWLGRRFHRHNWFEHTIADFGQSQGNVATGFVLADMVDPQRRTSTANDYGYKQLIYEPILGGGLITALSVPLITDIGLPAFTAVSVVLLLIVGAWGIRRGAS
ncbi:ESS family glutamate:Na+ symporter [Mycolicibacterium sp. BK556]|uniref:sodium/glutamate symporter n=1 Tax=Mycobacteriaceae TaxID=1762 RepID=UPI00106112DB|nr:MULTISPECIES: sodium/glutamate symporter [Mycobacteriaceae]MBB3603801.1 ESS family glutamate:Na+ symporter [Mycolicibacterium sp. BK556]MBB3633996.1 ESS family glutamate:Na+ symporter [Mycolicibacterium sp. BK607]MBB3751577.1 ESS family glutamate:Na+ symporter [Mycolicibacterium sp. BK634]TDO12094.1 ESS family glutamate:Na+ symporter [Mycobacterium sp. BK086]